MKLRALFFALSLSVVGFPAFAQTTYLPPPLTPTQLAPMVRPGPFPNSNVTPEFVQETLGKRLTTIGYAPTEPAFKMTIEGVAREVGRQVGKISAKQVAAAVVGGSAAIIAGVTTAPAWLTIAAGVAGTIVVGLAADYVYDWIVGADADGDGLNDSVEVEDVSVGSDGNTWIIDNCVPTSNAAACAGSSEGAVLEKYAETRFNTGSQVIEMNKVGNTWQIKSQALSNGAISNASITPRTVTAAPPASCDGAPFTYYYGSISGPQDISCDKTRPMAGVPLSPYDAANLIPDAVLQQPASPRLMSDMLNSLWSQASQDPAYRGVPYSPQNGFTEDELDGYRQQNPAAWPKVGDLVTPAAPGTIYNPQPVTWPTANPGGGTNPGTGTPPQNINVNVEVDLNPGQFQPPGVPAAPTMESILAPLLGLFPGLRDFDLQGPAGQCPTFEFDFHGHYVVDGHCQIMEDHRQLVGVIFLLLFTVAALRVVLSA